MKNLHLYALVSIFTGLSCLDAMDQKNIIAMLARNLAEYCQDPSSLVCHAYAQGRLDGIIDILELVKKTQDSKLSAKPTTVAPQQQQNSYYPGCTASSYDDYN